MTAAGGPSTRIRNKVRDIVHRCIRLWEDARRCQDVQKHRRDIPDYDRFGRTYEERSIEWLPTPFQIGRDGSVTIASYINNLDRTQFGAVYDDLAALFSTALPLIESVVGYVEQTKFWHEDTADIEHDERSSAGKGGKADPEKVSGVAVPGSIAGHSQRSLSNTGWQQTKRTKRVWHVACSEPRAHRRDLRQPGSG